MPSSTDAVNRGDRDRLVERSWNGAGEQVEVIRARRPGVQSGERARNVAGGLTRLRAYRGERAGFFFCGISARATVGVRELDQTELLAGVDLEVLAELALVRRGDREGRRSSRYVGLPRGVLGVLDDSVAAQQLGESRAIDDQREPAPRRPRDARPRAACEARPVTVAKRQVGVRGGGGRRSSAVPAGGRCSRSRARCALRPRVGRRRGLVDERVVQLPPPHGPSTGARHETPRVVDGRRSASRRPPVRRAARARPRVR